MDSTTNLLRDALMTTFCGFFFGALLVAAIHGMAKIQRQELLDASEAKRIKEARLAEFRARCSRPCD